MTEKSSDPSQTDPLTFSIPRDMNDIFPASDAHKTQWKTLLEGLKSEDETVQLQCLMELCNNFVWMTEDTVQDFRADLFLPILVQMLREGHDPNMMLYVCRAFSHLLEALPIAVGFLVRYGAVPVLCEKLMSIEYIDLAEQVIISLLKISEHPTGGIHILNAGGVNALLSFIDFFALDIQIKAMNAVANTLAIISKEGYSMVKDAVAMLNNLLQHNELQISEKACLSLYRIVKALSASTKELDCVLENGVPLNLLKVISIQLNAHDTQTAGKMIDISMKTLTLICKAYPSVVGTLMENQLIPILKRLMSLELEKEIRQKDLSQSVYTLISWIDTLLPVQIEESEEEKVVIHKQSPQELQNVYENNQRLYDLGSSLLLDLVSIGGSRSSNEMRRKCLTVILKMIVASSPEILTDILRELSFSSFIANQLTSRDMDFIWLSIHIIEDLMMKLPDIFRTFFVREGVVDALKSGIVSELENEDPQTISLLKRVKSFKDTYFNESQGVYHEALEEMNRISEAFVKSLNENSDTWKEHLRTIAHHLCEGTSSYEFMKSQIAKHLLSFFVHEDKTKPIEERRQRRHEKVSHFIEVFHELEKKGEFSAWIILVKVLEEAVGKLENMDVHMDSFEVSIRNLKYLIRPLRCKLVPKDSTDIKYEMEMHIEPLATIQKVSEYVETMIQKLRNREIRIETQVEEGIEGENMKQTDEEEEHNEEEERLNDEEEEHNEEEDIAMDDIDIHGNDEPMDRDDMDSLREGMEYEEDSESSSEEDSEDMDEDEYGSDYSEDEEFVDFAEMHDEEEGEEPIELSQSPNGTISQKNEPLKKNDDALCVQLFYQGKPLDENMTIYHFIRENPTTQTTALHSIWGQVYVFEYKLVDPKDLEAPLKPIDLQKMDEPFKTAFDYYVEKVHEQEDSSMTLDPKESSVSPVSVPLTQDDSFIANPELRTYLNLIEILSILHDSEHLKHNDMLYYNSKISSKINRQLLDPFSVCSGTLPSWMQSILIRYRFLFSMDLRSRFFRTTSFGMSRALFSIKDILSDAMDIRFGRLTRKKVRVYRDNIFNSSFSVFQLVRKSPTVLEVEYFDEVATGLGPTLEFYTLLSLDYQRKSLNMWVDQKSSEEYVFNSGGLFPTPTSSKDDNQCVKYFENFGSFVAKAIMDQRLLDIHFSLPMIKYLLGEPLLIEDMRSVYPEIMVTLEEFQQLINKKKEYEKRGESGNLSELLYKGGRVEDLYLTFTLPGYPDIELEENGTQKWVSMDNLESYVNLVIRHLFYDGVKDAMEAMIRGFNHIFDVDYLKYFKASEINTLIGGLKEQDSAWNVENLKDSTKCEHGYTMDSPVMQYMFEIMHEFTIPERRKFLQFLTGSPRLPPGGFQSLNPKLTFVKKDPDHGNNPDDYLPSVNTCFLYIKLPEYSTKEVTKKQLMQAIEHGQQGFSMS